MTGVPSRLRRNTIAAAIVVAAVLAVLPSSAFAFPPGPVTGLSAVAGANQATVSWTAPVGGTAPTSYVVIALSAGVNARNTTSVGSSPTSTTITGLAGGTAYKFSVYGVNAGNGPSTTTASTVTPTGTAVPFASAVLADSPTFFWRLDETAGTIALDSAGSATATGTEVGAPTQGSSGVLATDSDSALGLNGTSQRLYSNTSYANPTTFSIETWFKTSTATGGLIIGLASSQTGTAASADRQIYMANDGQLYFGVYIVSTSSTKVINSPLSYNDGNPHQVVATLGAGGLFLYVDGALVASDTTSTTPQSYTGYWRVGQDNMVNWPNKPTSPGYYFNGTIGQLAVYPTALSLQRVQVHYCAGANANCLSTTFPASASFPSLTLDGLNHAQTVAASFDITDSTNGNGWNLSATSTTFTAGAQSLPTTATTVASAPTAACDSGFTCTAPTNSVSYPYTLPAAGTAPTATELVNAAVGTGVGTPDDHSHFHPRRSCQRLRRGLHVNLDVHARQRTLTPATESTGLRPAPRARRARLPRVPFVTGASRLWRLCVRRRWGGGEVGSAGRLWA